jgi:hypothetical protein
MQTARAPFWVKVMRRAFIGEGEDRLRVGIRNRHHRFMLVIQLIGAEPLHQLAGISGEKSAERAEDTVA